MYVNLLGWQPWPVWQVSVAERLRKAKQIAIANSSL